MSNEFRDTEVLVIGGGGAGFRAAIGSREKGAKTTLLSKGPLARCGATPMAGADFTVDGKNLSEMGFNGEPTDSADLFFNDIVHQGFYLNNQKLVEQYLDKAPARLRELVEWQLPIFHSEERAVFTTGIAIMDALLRKARESGVELIEDTMLIDLIVEDGQVTGALALDIKTGKFIRFRTKAVIMATGGWHKAFWPNTGMRDLSGEGIAIAHQAGADIGNLEFITFACNVLLHPPHWRGSIATYILHTTLGGRLTNAIGMCFLDGYDPFLVETASKMEWNKSFISFATAKEVREGRGSPQGGVYYQRGETPWEAFEALAGFLFPNWKYKGLDLTELGRKLKDGETVEVGHCVEYFDGGIVVNERFETAVSGLYAAGECTLGPFGANRIASAITEMLVHGADAGENAAEFAKNSDFPKPSADPFRAKEAEASNPLYREKGISPAPTRRRIQEVAHTNLGPIRNRNELEEFLEILDSAKREQLSQLACKSKSRAYNKEWIDAIELKHMVRLLEAAAKSALFREESRGVHYREDFPHTDNDSWLCESIVKHTTNGFSIGTRPVATTKIEPPTGKIEYLAMMRKMMESRSHVGGHH